MKKTIIAALFASAMLSAMAATPTGTYEVAVAWGEAPAVEAKTFTMKCPGKQELRTGAYEKTVFSCNAGDDLQGVRLIEVQTKDGIRFVPVQAQKPNSDFRDLMGQYASEQAKGTLASLKSEVRLSGVPHWFAFRSE